MIFLTIRTDKPEAELGLYNNSRQLEYKTWRAHRELAETIHTVIHETLRVQQLCLHDVAGVVCFQGPGSFTGLRIGLTVGNALAQGLGISVVGVMGEEWQKNGLMRLAKGENDRVVLPEYGAPVHITDQKK